MQLVQVDDVHGRRAAVTTFASDASSLRFVLVPVCPVGEPAYYETVREMLRSCDLVVIVLLGPGGDGWRGCWIWVGARSGGASPAAAASG